MRARLDDLVLQSGDRQRPLPTIRLRYVRPAGRLRPIHSPVDSSAEVLEIGLEIRLVVLPCHPVHARGGLALERKERRPECVGVDLDHMSA
jgi:hypothetical protein